METPRFDEWIAETGLSRKPHQVEGVQFCVGNEQNGRGGLIADEMGLGKTYIMLGTMIENPGKKTLIVLPLALLEQWHKILADKCDGLDLFVSHFNVQDKNTKDFLANHAKNKDGPMEFDQRNPKTKGCKAYSRYESYKKAATYGEAEKLGMTGLDYRHDFKQGLIKNLMHKRIEAADVVITTYGKTLSRKNKYDETIHNFLYEYNWGRIIFDEAHHLRNEGTARFIGVNKLKCDIRWLITGTPIQNRMSDLYALCEIMGIKKEVYTDDNSLNWIANNYMLKRTKKDAGLDLPPVNVHIEEAEWKCEKERDLSEQIHSLLSFAQVNKSTGSIKPSIYAMGGTGQSILPYLIRARQACIYPQLVKKAIEKFVKEGVVEDDPEFLEAIESSSKIDQVVKTISDRKDNGRGKLIFCHFRGEIDILESRLSKLGLDVKTFDGRTSHNQRNEILENVCDVLILQIQTGCEGLNLQQFKEVYFVSPHWNPAIEDQAVARCHRIGQDAAVDVFRFTMKNFGSSTVNIEAHSTNLQETKREIVETFNDKTAD